MEMRRNFVGCSRCIKSLTALKCEMNFKLTSIVQKEKNTPSSHLAPRKRSIYNFYDENTENMFTYILPKQFAYSLHFPWYPFCRQLKTTQIISRSFKILNEHENFSWNLSSSKIYRQAAGSSANFSENSESSKNLWNIIKYSEISWNLQELPELSTKLQKKFLDKCLRCLRCFFAVFSCLWVDVDFSELFMEPLLLSTQKQRKVFGENSFEFRHLFFAKDSWKYRIFSQFTLFKILSIIVF